jgi:hypothetical protein
LALGKLWFVISIDYPAVRREFLETSALPE